MDIRAEGLRVRLLCDIGFNSGLPRRAGLVGIVKHCHGDIWGVSFPDDEGSISIGGHDASGNYHLYVDVCEPVEAEPTIEVDTFTGKKETSPVATPTLAYDAAWDSREPGWWTSMIELDTAAFFTGNVGSHKLGAFLFFGHDRTPSVEFSFFPDGPVALSKSEALDSIAALRTLLAATEAALRANDAPRKDEEPHA